MRLRTRNRGRRPEGIDPAEICTPDFGIIERGNRSMERDTGSFARILALAAFLLAMLPAQAGQAQAIVPGQSKQELIAKPDFDSIVEKSFQVSGDGMHIAWLVTGVKAVFDGKELGAFAMPIAGTPQFGPDGKNFFLLTKVGDTCMVYDDAWGNEKTGLGVVGKNRVVLFIRQGDRIYRLTETVN